jgi:hypothetical protein
MFQLKFLFLLFTLTYEQDYFSLCDVKYEWKDVCFKYEFSATCLPWDIKLCQNFILSQNDFYCPVFDCNVSGYF